MKLGNPLITLNNWIIIFIYKILFFFKFQHCYFFNFYSLLSFWNLHYIIYFKKFNNNIKIFRNFDFKISTINLFFYKKLYIYINYFFIYSKQIQINNLKFIDLKKKHYKSLKNYGVSWSQLFFKKNKTKSFFKKKIAQYFYLFSTYSIFYKNYYIFFILLHSKMILNYCDYIYFKQQKFIWLNRANVFIFFLTTNNILELFFIKFFFLYLKKIINKINTLNALNLNFKKNLYKKKKFFNFSINDYFNKLSTKIYLEIDFFSLSIILLNSTFVLQHFNNNNFNFFNFYHFKLLYKN